MNPLFKSSQNPPSSSPSAASDRLPDQDLRDTLPAYTKVGAYLAALLVHEYNMDPTPEVFEEYTDGEEVIRTFRVQFSKYTRQAPPFNRHDATTWPINYWKKLRSHPDASIIGVRDLDLTFQVVIILLIPLSACWCEVILIATKLDGRRADGVDIHETQLPRPREAESVDPSQYYHGSTALQGSRDRYKSLSISADGYELIERLSPRLAPVS